MNVLYINPGSITVRPNECALQTGIISAPEVTQSEDMQGDYTVGSEEEGGHYLRGGHFMRGGKLGGGFSHMVRLGRKHRAAMKEALPAVKELVQNYKSRM